MRIPMNATGVKVHLLRHAKEKGITLQEIAHRTGFALSTVRNILYNYNSQPLRLPRYLEICEALCDTREEYGALITEGIKQAPEYMFAERRLRWKEKNNNNDNQ